MHHEDIRRAQPSWVPRGLAPRAQDALWKAVRVAGKGLVRSARVGVVLERTDTGERAVLKKAAPEVVVRGLPEELVLYVYGRKPESMVELVGDDEAVARLSGSDLGV